MLERTTIEKFQVNQQDLYNRRPKSIKEGIKTASTIPYFYEISEVFIEQQKDTSIEQQLKESAIAFAKALSAVKGRTVFILSGNGQGRISLAVANSQNDLQLQALISSINGTMNYAKVQPTENHWSHYAALTYTPALDLEKENTFISVIDSFLKSNWRNAFEVRIVIQVTDQSETLLTLSSMYEEVYPYQQIQTSASNSESIQKQKSTSHTKNESAILVGQNMGETDSETISSDSSSDRSTEYKSYAIERYCEQLSYLMDRQLLANSIGQFQVGIYIASNKPTEISSLQSAIQQSSFEKEFGEGVDVHNFPAIKQCFNHFVFPNEESRFSPIFGYSSLITNVLTSQELARLIQLPSQSYDGFEVKALNDFEVNRLPYEENGDVWLMGKQFVRNVLTEKEVKYSYSNLRRHCLISGITGSGKTNTVMSLLKDSPVPFLIIEPTKQEYRHLLSIDQTVKVFTPGNERISPIRLNPFYFPEGISVMSHIDSLKAVFMSAFSMYASMPNILEQCLYSIYQKVGWDLNQSVNVFANDGIKLTHFPTLELLYEEIDLYLDKSGYAEEQKSNIRAALLTRIKSLMTGSKGKMLNTQDTIDFADLLNSKAVIELEEIADEDDKALIIGLFFIRLSEQFKVDAEEKLDAELKHFTIIEEAHRLFKNHEESTNPEIANTKGKAVEFFCNILSEIRSKGEGIIIIDQVPTKLAPDALKNTDTKIIHRLVSQDDAEYVAQALAIANDEDLLFLSQLKRGEALFFTSGMYKAGHVLVNAAKSSLSYVKEIDIQQVAEKYNSFVINAELEHPMAEYILRQNERLVSTMLNQYRKFYHNALYGNTMHINNIVSKFVKDLSRNVEKVGYIIPKEQKGQFMITLCTGLTEKYLNSRVYFSNFKLVKDEVSYYLNLLLKNHDYDWSENELNVFEQQRQKVIHPLLINATELLLFDEEKYEWMESSRNVVDGEVIFLSKYMELSGLLDEVDINNFATDNASKVFKKAIQILQDEFIIWSWNEYAKQLLLRSLTQLFGWESKSLLVQFEVWLEKESMLWC
ncbi:ATP-binding protein [Lysinibacillus mangiferihumi]|uniref:ATP-binding protein n=1 Tax=Lysinibacillus mangiferihumi TaxID=1130819 RepID=A0A4V5TMH0_9BACI|nr:ATP-binding protein [Lysinibacillus mangiferihumi]TKI71893.1 ATP-binding protein [Lysinibacillus mangiferihumi]